MKKYIILITSIVLILVSACGKVDSVVNNDLAQNFLNSDLFTESLEMIDVQTAELRYGLNTSDYNEITAYVGTKSNCDEFIIINTDNTAGVTQQLAEYFTDKAQEYYKYRPAEVYKLATPFVEEYNGTVVAVICHDNQEAKTVFNEYLKG